MNVNNFTSQIFKSDLARDNLFTFEFISVPEFIRSKHDSNDIRSTTIYAKGVTFSPNSVTNNPRLGDGYKRVKTVQEVLHQSDLEMTLLLDPAHTHYKMIEMWITGMMLVGDTVRYLDDCLGACSVKQFDRLGKITTEFSFTDVYPMSIGPKVYATGTAGTPSEVTVNFSYRDMSIIK